jgi:hypothetical protein
MTTAEMVLEKLIQSPFNHLTLLVALAAFIGLSCPENFTLYNKIKWLDIMTKLKSLAYLGLGFCVCARKEARE